MITYEWKMRKWVVWFAGIVVTGVVMTGCMITQPVWFDPDLDLTIPKSSPENLTKHVRKLSEEFYPRSYTDRENLNKCADYIKKQLKLSNPTELDEQVYTTRRHEYRNIIARFKGNPESESWIVVGAHYDGHDDTPGADDNASGVAGLLELSRLLGENPLPLNIELVAYTLEEPPFFKDKNMGSYRHAQRLSENKVKVEYALVLEMIGRFSDEEDSQNYPSPIMHLCYPDKGNFIGLISNSSCSGLVKDMKIAAMKGATLPIRSINAPAAIPGVDFSDHWSYWQFDYDAAMLCDTAFYRHNDYHEMTDTWEKLDYPRMANVVEMAYSILKNKD